MKQNNPIIPRKGVCDPHVHIFRDVAYLYASHDSSIENETWLMKDWQIWSSENLVDWHLESTFHPEDTYIGPCNRCWAVDAAEKNGRYYYYFSNGNIDTGVAVADHPGGPFRDALGKPLLSKDLTSTLQYDPTVFVDPDTDIPYLIWGCVEGNGYFIAQLNEDMVSLSEEPREILIDGGHARDDKSFLHKKGDTFYLSWGSFYASADSVYGPYTFRGTLGISEDHGSFFSWKGQDYYAFTIFDPNNFYRSTGLCYIHYRKNGDMVADQMIAEYGVGAYDSNWNKVQAEWFMEGISVEKKENIWGGFDVGGINNTSSLLYPNIRGIKGKTKIHIMAASLEKESEIEIYDEKHGCIIGRCKITETGAYDHCGYKVFTSELNLQSTEELLNMRFVFKGEGSELMRIHWFKFS